MGNSFMRKLQELKERFPKHIADVRGRGLLIGLEFQAKEIRERVQVELFHKGVLVAATMNSNKTVRIEPPLIITQAQINFMVETLESVLEEMGEIEIQPAKAEKKRKKKAK
jgi:putrescine aminotransferase